MFAVRQLLQWSLLFALVSCGFHLRGQAILPNELSPMFVDARVSAPELVHELKALLKTSNIVLAEDKDKAASVVVISSVKKSRRVLSVDASGRAREYELNYQLRYLVSGKAVNTAEKELSLNRELLFDPGNVLAATYEEQALYEDMVKDGARRVLLQLQAIQVTGSEL